MAPETRNFGPLAGRLWQIRTSVSSFFCWREKFEISVLALDPAMKPAVRIGPILFFLLRGSVPPWCKGLVFGCGFIAPGIQYKCRHPKMPTNRWYRDFPELPLRQYELNFVC